MHYDVIAAGGGVAGVCAAIAAARCGKHTLLVDRQILLGGMVTLGRINWLEPYCDGRGHAVFGGLAQELFERATNCGYQNIPRDWPAGERRLTSWFSPEAFALSLPSWLEEENVELLLDAQVTGARLEGRRVTAITVSHMAGSEELEAEAFIDGTGMAQLFFLTGLPCVSAENYLTMIGDTAREANLRTALEARTPYLVRGRRNFGASLNGKGQPENVPAASVNDAREMTRWVLDAQRLMRDALAGESVRDREILSLPAIPQIRMLRRIEGRKTFSAVPFMDEPDSIGVIPDMKLRGELYELPFGSLRAQACDNLYAVGRCISAEDMGWHNSRVVGPCCLTGEAAGIAACVDGDLTRVQHALQANGVKLKNQELRDTGKFAEIPGKERNT